MSLDARVLLAGEDAFRFKLLHLLGGCPAVEVRTVDEAAAALLSFRPLAVLVDFRAAPAPDPLRPPDTLAGHAICRRVKGAASTRLLPVIAFADDSPEAHVAALELGADHVLPFPPVAALLQARLRAIERSSRDTDRLEDATQVIYALANAVEAKDAYTEGHTERVGALAVEIARLAGLDEDTQDALRQAGVLHDIGKIGIPNEIINKAGLLTVKERIVMNKHPLIGERICEPLKTLRNLLPIIRWHHEKLDGSGYPDGLVGRAFPLPAQVLQLSDIFDAITTDRPYHVARTRASAIEFLAMEAGKGWRDAELVKLVAQGAERLGLGRTRVEDIPPPPAPVGQRRSE
jgi:putative two-component system response regulator